MTSLATVAEIWIYPVKSMRGVQLAGADVDRSGLRGDRTWAVQDVGTGGLLTAAQLPVLREVTPTAEAPLRLELPADAGELAGRYDDGEEERPERLLSSYLGREVALVTCRSGTWADDGPVHLISRQAMARTPEDPRAFGGPCSVADVRANLVLDLAAGVADERDLLGTEVTVGSARLLLTRPPEHCLGVYASVVQAGRIEAGAVVDGEPAGRVVDVRESAGRTVMPVR